MYNCTALIFVMAIAALSSAAVQRNNSTLSQTRDTNCNTNGVVAISLANCCNNGQCCGNFLSDINGIQFQCAEVPVNACGNLNGGSGCGAGQVCSQLFNIPIIGGVAQAQAAGYTCCSQYDNDFTDTCRQYGCSEGYKRINEASTKWYYPYTDKACCNNYICNQ